MTVYYSKQFQTGLLKGLVVHQAVSFATQEAADRFAMAMRPGTKHRDAMTGNRFTVVDMAYQNYAR